MALRLNIVLYGGPMHGMDYAAPRKEAETGTIIVEVDVNGKKESHRYDLTRGFHTLGEFEFNVPSWQWKGKVEDRE